MEPRSTIILIVSINLSLCNTALIFVDDDLVCDITQDLLIKPTFSCVKCDKRNIPDCYSNGYNETHVWFPFEALQLECVAITKDILNVTSCQPINLPPSAITIPSKCGKDVYGNPIKCTADFNK